MKPKPGTRRVWPVYGFRAGGYFDQQTVAHFFSWGDAADFATQPVERGAFEQRALYMAPSRAVECKGGSFHADL